MKITVYTTKDCAFSKQEKEYLTSHSLQFEEKDLETNKEFLTEMLAVSNNFAGTPVTRVEKDDASIAVLKGFTKEEFDTTFGFAVETAAPAPAVSEPPKVEETKPVVPAATEVKPLETPTMETPATPATAPVSEAAPTDAQLNSVLDKLQEKTNGDATPPAETPAAPTEAAQPPADAPSIPDFPADAKTTA